MISKISRSRRVLHFELKTLKKRDLQARLTKLKQKELADLQEELVRKAELAEKN